jgi:predicted lipoprotein with Yx(FWY)xxD motif
MISSIMCLGSNGIPEKVMKIKTIQSTTVGNYVVDDNEIALYTFDLDTFEKSNCVSASCVAVWPPFIVDTKTVTSESITGTIGYITRSDSKIQVTLNGWHLYYYKGEVDKPKVHKCQGIFESSGIWYLISPDGRINFQTKEVTISNTNAILKLSKSTQYGSTFLTDGKGVVLYMFETDRFMNSTCFNSCEVVWPVYGPSNDDGDKFFTSTGSIASDQSFKLTIGIGLNPNLLSIAKRKVATVSPTKYIYTYNGWPLYYYRKEKDGEAEKIGCQAIEESGGYWWILDSNGDVNTESSSSAKAPKLVISWSSNMYSRFASLKASILNALNILVLILLFLIA